MLMFLSGFITGFLGLSLCLSIIIYYIDKNEEE